MDPPPVFHAKIPELLTVVETSSTFDIDLPQAESYTISFWFWVQSAKQKQVILYEGQTYQPNWEIYVKDNHICCTSDNLSLMFDFLVDSEKWYYIVLQFKGYHFTSYINGEQLPGTDHDIESFITQKLTLTIGGYTDPAGGHYDYTFGRTGTGLIDDLQVDSPALTETDIQSYYLDTDETPNANFTVAQEGATVRFSADGSTSHNWQIESYIWDYGDGQRGYGQHTEHQYTFSDNYAVTLRCIDQVHQQAVTKQYITVGGQQQSLESHPVFVNGEEGYACYRIPAIVRAINGDLLAFAEGRKETCSDATETIHAVCKRSFDSGQTWQPLQIVARNSERATISTIQNISPIVDTVHGTGRIIVAYNASEYSEWDVTAGTGISRTHIIFSDDHGATWYGETDITSQVHRPYQPESQDATNLRNRLHDWRMHRPTLGHGLQLSTGRLIFAGSITQGNLSVFQSQNVIFWSDDLGQHWHIGGVIPRVGMNEAIALELENGDLMVNTRAYQDEQSLNYRAVTIGTFVGDDLIAFRETYLDEALVDSAVQATTIRYTHSDEKEYGGKSRILFANPSHPHARRKLTVRLSYDEGQTWTVNKVIDHGLAAYSDLVIQADMQIGLLYERGNQGGVWYSYFTLDWLTDEQDSLTQGDP